MAHPLYIQGCIQGFSKHNVSETGFCLRLQVKPTQLGLIDRASPYLRTPIPARRWGIRQSGSQILVDILLARERWIGFFWRLAMAVVFNRRVQMNFFVS
jgi:hypothetical protein